MKITKESLITVALSIMCILSYAQTNQPDYKNPPKPKEKVLGTISLQTKEKGDERHWSDQEVYVLLLEKAKTEYPNKVIDIRDMKNEENCRTWDETRWDSKLGKSKYYMTHYYYKATAVGKVVYTPDPNTQTAENFSAAIDKAFRNVREGSRIAIDQVSVTGSINREDIKDQLIDILLDKGYKVVAKEHLDKLYEEQQAQQSGIYNDKTTVQDNNFSAVGYYVNVKITETSLRVQVINVSTGEYEGNATVNF